MEKTIKNTRYIYLDLLRLVAIFFVIFIHTPKINLITFFPNDKLSFGLGSILETVCVVGVPLFFMITGATSLGRERNSIIQLKRIAKYGIILFVFSILYFITTNINSLDGESVKVFVVELYSNTLCGHLWFLYAYIAYLIAEPYLTCLVINLKKKYYEFLLALYICFNSLMPFCEAYIFKGTLHINQNVIPSWLFTNIVIYPIIGYYIHNNLVYKKVRLIVINTASLICLVMCAYFGCRSLVYKTSESITNYFLPINLISIFYSFKCCENGIRGKKIKKCIETIGKSTFGVYLIHLLFFENELIISMYKYLISVLVIPVLAPVIYSCLVLVISIITVLSLSKVPIIKKLLGY